MVNENAVRIICCDARDGARVRFTPADETKAKTLWSGLGNRSGLHGYADVLTSQKWQKSGARFKAKLASLDLVGGKLELQTYKHITRDRGRWVTYKTFTV